jgi:hypothetical protein
MKTSEECFCEIVSLKNNIVLKKDDEKVRMSPYGWSKMRNFDNDYMFDGEIKLDESNILYFFFSNKRSCLSTNSKCVDILPYVNDLFDKYHIDEFIKNLSKTL